MEEGCSSPSCDIVAIGCGGRCLMSDRPECPNQFADKAGDNELYNTVLRYQRGWYVEKDELCLCVFISLYP